MPVLALCMQTTRMCDGSERDQEDTRCCLEGLFLGE